MTKKMQSMDGNTAATHVANAFSDVAAIFPITPSSPMGEKADAWAATGRKNIFGETVDVIEMQSEGGASGAVHGTLSGGALTTTFTASQGLMLMLPNMHKIAGEMLPTVFHVSARSLACQSLSIFGDHSDVMSARNTGFALLASASIQEIMDLAAVAHMSTVRGKIPFVHFFDGFRNSHEIQKIDVVDYDVYKELNDDKGVAEFRNSGLNPQRPYIKVGAQNPDVYFQGRETVNKYYDALPEIVQAQMDKYAEVTGRQYRLFDYAGAPDAEKIIIAMGSGVETVEETINSLNAKGAKLGLLKVRLYRPFSVDHFLKAIPDTVKKIAVLDRTKEPGSIGEPLYLDVVAALKDKNITIIGGRYGLSSKEFTPAMVKAVYDHLDGACTHNFTVGIIDDVTDTSLPIGEEIDTTPEGTISCKFWGLGSDGTVGAHLRFGDSKIQAEYIVTTPDFVACHQQSFIERYDLLKGIKEGGTFLLNSSWSNDEVFENLREDQQKTIIEKKIKLYNVDALKIANEVGLGKRINSVMMTAFFLISGVLDRDKAITLIKDAVKKTYIKKGQKVVDMNWVAIDKTNEALVAIETPSELPGKSTPQKQFVPAGSTGFVKNVVERVMKLEGDDIPVSQMPLDGAVPCGTMKLEKRGVSPEVSHWIADKCTQCNQCSYVCPHAAIRPKLIDRELLQDKPATFNTLTALSTDKEKYDYKLQVFVDDCQGCNVCVNACPSQALEMKPAAEERAAGEIENEKFFNSLPEDVLSTKFKTSSVKGSQFKQPLMEFSGACAGCGETPYVKLLTQLFGDRMIIANATGCTSIWGGTFPTVPYCTNKYGDGPAWANSLFEDNAEYGLGMRLAVTTNRKQLKSALDVIVEKNIDSELKDAIKTSLTNWDSVDEDAKANARKIKSLLPAALADACCDEVKALVNKVIELKDYFIEKSVWAFGGDGWAYDIGYGGLDHVLASGKNINVLVVDTEVYSNTGGQASKATPLGSIARFAESGKETTKKDLGKMLMGYKYVYVASIAMGANKNQMIKAMLEAEAYDGPSIIIAYAPCINHGFDMSHMLSEEKLAVDTGYWVLYRYNPDTEEGKNPLTLDSRDPKKSVEEFLDNEKRYSALKTTFPDKEARFRKGTIKFLHDRYNEYKKLAE